MSLRALLWVTVAAASGTLSVEPEGPVVVVRSTTTGAPDDGADDVVAMSLSVASLPPEDRVKLLSDLGYTTARLEARLSPVADDLGDEDVAPLDELRHELAPRMPTLNAARALTRRSWAGAGLEVRVAASCKEAGADETCVRLWDESEENPLLRRARFVTWSVARAAVLELGSVEEMSACAAKLRSRAIAAWSDVALVVTTAESSVAEVAEREELRNAAKQLGRAMHANHLRDERHLDALARESPKRTPLPFRLGPTSLAVIPRLSSLAHRGGVTMEIESACGGRGRWIHRP
jgi:hypothetical protein